jgi:hypothetical protein
MSSRAIRVPGDLFMPLRGGCPQLSAVRRMPGRRDCLLLAAGAMEAGTPGPVRSAGRHHRSAPGHAKAEVRLGELQDARLPADRAPPGVTGGLAQPRRDAGRLVAGESRETESPGASWTCRLTLDHVPAVPFLRTFSIWELIARYPQRQCISRPGQSHRSSMPGCYYRTYSSAAIKSRCFASRAR